MLTYLLTFTAEESFRTKIQQRQTQAPANHAFHRKRPVVTIEALYLFFFLIIFFFLVILSPNF